MNVDFSRLGILILVVFPRDSGFGGSSRWVPGLERVGDGREGVVVSGRVGGDVLFGDLKLDVGGSMLGDFCGGRGDVILEDCGEGVRDSLGLSWSSGDFCGGQGDAILEDCGEGVRDSLGVSSSSGVVSLSEEVLSTTRLGICLDP